MASTLIDQQKLGRGQEARAQDVTDKDVLFAEARAKSAASHRNRSGSHIHHASRWGVRRIVIYASSDPQC